MPHFDWTVSFGTILTILSLAIAMIATYTKGTKWLAMQFTRFEITLEHHATQLGQHAARMDRFEEHYVEIAGHLQRIIGRIETQDQTPWPKNRRRENSR